MARIRAGSTYWYLGCLVTVLSVDVNAQSAAVRFTESPSSAFFLVPISALELTC